MSEQDKGDMFGDCDTIPCPICGGWDDERQLQCEACGGVGMLGTVEPMPTNNQGVQPKAASVKMRTFKINRRSVEDQILYVTAPNYAEALRRAKARSEPKGEECHRLAERATLDGFDTSDTALIALTYRSLGEDQ